MIINKIVASSWYFSSFSSLQVRISSVIHHWLKKETFHIYKHTSTMQEQEGTVQYPLSKKTSKAVECLIL